MSSLRITHLALLLWLPLVAACGGAKQTSAEPKDPSDSPPSVESEEDGDPLHEALVETHRSAVEACFGGFGKGASYAAELTVADGAVSEAEVTPLSDGHGPLPADCIAKHFKAMKVPGDTSGVSARFAVENDDCSLPECGEQDLPCHFKRDIRCSVVVDER